MHYIATLAVLFLPLGAPEHPGSKASGELTETAVVTSSVSVTFSPDGRLATVVANGPADQASLISEVVQSRPTLRNKSSKHRLRQLTRKAMRPFPLLQ
jgi:hypothetical protein